MVESQKALQKVTSAKEKQHKLVQSKLKQDMKLQEETYQARKEQELLLSQIEKASHLNNQLQFKKDTLLFELKHTYTL